MNAFDKIAITTRAFFREVLGPPSPRSICPSPKLNGTVRLPVDMLVIDVSLSMDFTDYPPTRLDGAKQAAARFLQKRFDVSADALVGIATFCRKGQLVSTPLPIRTNLVRLQECVQSLSTGSATNVSAGLSIAQAEILKARSTETKRIILLTDGDSNTGPNPVTTYFAS
jgi:Mg-chelatase subunit ChlD